MAQISKKTALLWVLVVAAMLVIWRFIWQPMQKNQTAHTEASSANSVNQPGNSSETANPIGEEADSETKISVRTSYKNPGGEDEVGFSLTVNEEGVITAANAEVLAKNPTSIMRQKAFAAEFPAAIQGKKLSELTAIDRVGGSSLTTGSFNASLDQLKAGLN